MNPEEIERAGNLYAALREFEENKDKFAQYIANVAWAKRKFFEVCLREGFNEVQATQLTTAYNPFQAGA